MNLFKVYIDQYKNEINLLDLNIDNEYITSKYENDINQNSIKALKKRFRNKRNDEIEIMLLTNAKPIIDKIRKDFLDKEKNEILKKKNDLNKNLKSLENQLNNLDQSLKDLESRLIEYKLIDNNLIKNLLPILKINLIDINIKYTKPIFRTKNIKNKNNRNNIVEEDEKYFPIRGGCYPEINHSVRLSEMEEFNEQSYKEFIKEKTIKNNNKKYYVVKTELRNGFIYGKNLDYLSKSIDINEIYLKICGIISKDHLNKISQNYKNLIDTSGNSLSHYKVMNSSIFGSINNIQQNDLNKINNFSESPELYSILTGNSKKLKEIISNHNSNFTRKTEGYYLL